MKVTNSTIIEILSIKFNLDLQKILKKPYGSRVGFTGEELLIALLSSSNMDEAANILGYSTRDPVKDAVKSYLFEISKHGGNNCKWKNVLLLEAGYHRCTSCKIVLPIEDFGLLNTRNIGIQSLCKKCSFISSKNRKQFIKERTPKWVDSNELLRIYHNCPPGYHVDHIIPLRGKLVSGLHIPENMQYLLVEENQSKSNNIDLDELNITYESNT